MYLLDTTHCLGYLFGFENTVSKFRDLGAEQLSTSVVVRGELLYGVYKSDQINENLSLVEKLFDIISLLPVNKVTADIFAEIKADILNYFGPKDRNKRRNVKFESLGFKDNDLWIAATAIQYRLILVSADSDLLQLNGIKDLKVENW
jgi:tRNA(fMet)-specific endonuclease VapC